MHVLQTCAFSIFDMVCLRYFSSNFATPMSSYSTRFARHDNHQSIERCSSTPTGQNSCDQRSPIPLFPPSNHLELTKVVSIWNHKSLALCLFLGFCAIFSHGENKWHRGRLGATNPPPQHIAVCKYRHDAASPPESRDAQQPLVPDQPHRSKHQALRLPLAKLFPMGRRA